MSVPEPSPCPYCTSSSFAFIGRAKIELTSDAKVGFGNVLNPEISLLVCRGCGHAAWFLRDHEQTLEGIKHDRLTAPQKGYR